MSTSPDWVLVPRRKRGAFLFLKSEVGTCRNVGGARARVNFCFPWGKHNAIATEGVQRTDALDEWLTFSVWWCAVLTSLILRHLYPVRCADGIRCSKACSDHRAPVRAYISWGGSF